ncbi:hypothetical protein FB45DRAFT_867472 [Roridomyces roridus]|uniref:Uncharacterized protein n=1 Tax=Roridomyces roridus TaxID=1738132 RepID=A0AAD7BQX2_9AGAR|nr:hypothetical protein FB45DRAFT_867472 [Roridomyces roridus]
MPSPILSPLAVRSISPIIIRHCSDYYSDPLPTADNYPEDTLWPSLYGSSLDIASQSEVKKMMDVEYSPAGGLGSRDDAGCDNCFHNTCPGGTWGTPCGDCLIRRKSDCNFTSREAFVKRLRSMRDEYLALNERYRTRDDNLRIYYANCKMAFVIFDQTLNVARWQFAKGVRSFVDTIHNPHLVLHLHLLATELKANIRVIAALEQRYNYLNRAPVFPIRHIEGWLYESSQAELGPKAGTNQLGFVALPDDNDLGSEGPLFAPPPPCSSGVLKHRASNVDSRTHGLLPFTCLITRDSGFLAVRYNSGSTRSCRDRAFEWTFFPTLPWVWNNFPPRTNHLPPPNTSHNRPRLSR